MAFRDEICNNSILNNLPKRKTSYKHFSHVLPLKSWNQTSIICFIQNAEKVKNTKYMQ